MNGCLKCIHKPFCNLSGSGAVCSSFKDKDRYADRNEVIREFAERVKESFDASLITGREDFPCDYICEVIDQIAEELIEKHDR